MYMFLVVLFSLFFFFGGGGGVLEGRFKEKEIIEELFSVLIV